MVPGSIGSLTMSDNDNSRRRTIVIVILLLLILALLLLLTQCRDKSAPLPPAPGTAPPVGTGTKGGTAPATALPDEVLTPATLIVPQEVAAGSAFSVQWTGPDNRDDYVTVVKPDAAAATYGPYRNTSEGPALSLTAPIEPGDYEVRYVTTRSRTILGRATIRVIRALATIDAPAQAVAGTRIQVGWAGPNNAGDYITVVPVEKPDGQFGNFTNTAAGNPLSVLMPVMEGDAELRYMTGQGAKVLARRAIKVVAAQVTLAAPDEAVAGARIAVTWTGPNGPGDFITIVPIEKADGQFGNYTNTSNGSPLNVLTPIMEGNAELRYMTAQGSKVLARRAVKIVAAKVTLAAPAQCAAGSSVAITWTGPNHGGDFITIVTKKTPDGGFAAYQTTTAGSPLSVKAPKEAGEAEIRYMTGQGSKVLARIPITVVP